ncbi:MAG: hypothetical protein Q9221_006967 [Calogaya cf. arnoldii]
MATCGFEGDSDIYGIGIRIGYYTQAFSLWFANFFVLREAKHLRGINTVFVFALGIAGSIYAYNARNTYAVEAFLLLQIAICIGAASVMKTTRYSSRYLRRSEQSLLLRTFTFNAGLVFNLCYWWRGLDLMKPTPCTNGHPNPTPTDARMEGHQTYACYIIKTNLYGWMRLVMKVGAVVALVNYIFTDTACNLAEAIQIYKLRSTRSNFAKQVASLGIHETIEPQAAAVVTQPPQNLEKTNLAVQNTAQDSSAGAAASHPQSPRRASDGGSFNIQAISPAPPGNSYPPESSTLSGLGSSSFVKVNENTIKSSPDRPPKRPEVFLQVQRAESYLNLIFRVPEDNQDVLHKQKTSRTTGGFLKFCAPNLKWPEINPIRIMRYAGCYLRIMWENDLPADLRWRISFHLTSSGKYPQTHVLKYLYRMRELNAAVQPPDWQMVAIASDVQLSQIPLIVTPSVWVWQAVQSLIVFKFLIIQVELTIAWNHVHGLKTLSSLGQLIPFVLGVGGLLKVVWAKWCLVRKGIGEDVDANLRPLTAYEEAMVRYIEWSKSSKSHSIQKPVSSPQSVNPPSQEQSQV